MPRSLTEQYKYETEERGLCHKDALDQMKWMFTPEELTTIPEPCKSIVNFETNERCREPATNFDGEFRYPLCDRHAEIAYKCMDADADILANAY